jgi:hypothetical protein
MEADNSLMRRQSGVAMTIAKTYAKYRADGQTCTREEFHYAAIENLPMIRQCLGLPYKEPLQINAKKESS